MNEDKEKKLKIIQRLLGWIDNLVLEMREIFIILIILELYREKFIWV